MDFLLIQEKFTALLFNGPPNVGDVFRLVLHGLNTLAEQHPLLFCVDGWRPEAQDSGFCVLLLDCRAAVHSAELASALGDMTHLEESVTVAQHQMDGVQFA